MVIHAEYRVNKLSLPTFDKQGMSFIACVNAQLLERRYIF
jgi:hypothetical protein